MRSWHDTAPWSRKVSPSANYGTALPPSPLRSMLLSGGHNRPRSPKPNRTVDHHRRLVTVAQLMSAHCAAGTRACRCHRTRCRPGAVLIVDPRPGRGAGSSRYRWQPGRCLRLPPPLHMPAPPTPTRCSNLWPTPRTRPSLPRPGSQQRRRSCRVLRSRHSAISPINWTRPAHGRPREWHVKPRPDDRRR